jgi:uncharacterized protein YbjT (DUF2867 family)
MSGSLSVLVIGATGNQGGALARRLLSRGHRVRGLTRDPGSPAARTLEELGAELVAGDFDDPASLERAAAGTDAVFAMSTPFEAGAGAEARQGMAVASAAQAAGVGHLVYSSVASADRNTGISHFESKYRIEQHIQALHIPYTIVAPVYFMENLFLNLPGLRRGQFALPLPAGRTLQQVPVQDVAAFAALVLERRRDFLGVRLDIASDELTGVQVAQVLSHVSGREIEFVEVPPEQVRARSQEYAVMMNWLNRVGYSADVAGLRRDYPEVGWHTYEEWAMAQDWSILESGE